jgi:HNH endonuclease
VRGIPENPEIRFWKLVTKLPGDNSCWEFSNGRGKEYGSFKLHTKHKVRAHRFSYELEFGEIPKGLSVLHKCDNPPCVRPDHLFLGTQGDNVRDAARKGRHPHGERVHFHRWKENDVRKVKAMKALGIPNYIISREIGMSDGKVSRICRGLEWRHV